MKFMTVILASALPLSSAFALAEGGGGVAEDQTPVPVADP